MKRVFLILMYVVALVLCALNVGAYNKTYAVIVAVADYKYATAMNGDLKYTVNDASKFYNFLKSAAGGSVPSANIVYLTNSSATRSNIITKTKTLFANAKTDDRVIFYFSGHGDRACFLPYDTDSYGNNLLWFDEVQVLFRCAKCNNKLLIADACFSGSMKNLIKRQTAGRTTSSSNEKQQIAVMMASGANEESV